MAHSSEVVQMRAFTVRSPSRMLPLLLAGAGQPEAALLHRFSPRKKDRIVVATAEVGPETIAGLGGTWRGCLRSRPGGGRGKPGPPSETSLNLNQRGATE